MFIPAFLNYLSNKNELPDFSNWVAWGKERLVKYPVCLEEYWLKDNGVNPYCFIDELSKYTIEGDNIICADGTACVTTFQAIKVKKIK